MKTKERGITLIALVVTIIVLLILAGVSIQMLTGQSGILGQAKEAKKQTEIAEAKENAQREILEEMMLNGEEDIGKGKIHDILEKYFSGVPDLTNGVWKDFPKGFPKLKVKGTEYEVNIADIYSGSIGVAKAGEVAEVPEEKKWDLNKVTPIADGQGNSIPVPKKFYYVGGTKDTGFVISDVKEDNLNNDAGGNQFVWIPLPKAISETEVSTNTNSINLDLETTPMAEFVDGKYRGVLYQTWDVSTKTVKYIQYSETGRREPDIVTGTGEQYDKVVDNLQKIKSVLTYQTDKYTDGDTFKKTMQDDYKEMINSVEKYGGFYVARYEMSLSSDETKNSQYKKGEIPATGKDWEWYGLYAYNKKFATENNYSSVKSSMIWGSQYDAMMNWMARCGIDVTKKIGDDRNKNTDRKTGLGNTGEDDSKDVLNNIYDLYGNLREWTLEADSATRTGRGGYIDGNDFASFRINNGGDFPTSASYNSGSRASLYIAI